MPAAPDANGEHVNVSTLSVKENGTGTVYAASDGIVGDEKPCSLYRPSE